MLSCNGPSTTATNPCVFHLELLQSAFTCRVLHSAYEIFTVICVFNLFQLSCPISDIMFKFVFGGNHRKSTIPEGMYSTAEKMSHFDTHGTSWITKPTNIWNITNWDIPSRTPVMMSPIQFWSKLTRYTRYPLNRENICKQMRYVTQY